MPFTTSDLLDSIKRKSFVPEGQTTFTDVELLAIADEQVLNTIVPSIIDVREEFLVYYTDYAITGGKNAYDIPARAVGMSVREIAIVDGETINPDFPRLEPERLTNNATDNPTGFYLKNNQIVLYPTPSATAKVIRVYFFLAPSRHVETSSAAVVTAIAGNVVTVGSIPSTWITGNAFDLIKQDGGQEPLSIDLTSTLVSGTDITLPSVPDTLRVGDYVALAGETPLVQLPAEYRPILAQAVAADVLESMNQPGAEKASKTLMKQLEVAQKLVSPRVQGEPRVIVGSTWF